MSTKRAELAGVTAVLGGTFDPPHNGHLKAIEGLIQDCGVAQVLVLPTPSPPHKPSTASPKQRVEMAEIAFGNLGTQVRLDWREFARAKRQPAGQPIYTYETLLELRREHPNLAFVIGSDQLEKLPTWKRFPELLSLCHWIVLQRKPGGHERALKALQEWTVSGLVKPAAHTETLEWTIRSSSRATSLWLVPTPAPEVSSTFIREQLAKSGQQPDGTLAPQIALYLKTHRLYGMKAH
jgi:nicotinate-nucleotide adenylyltransferase